MSSSNSPCAACKCRRQKCTQDCVFAPYFPPDQSQKFMKVSHVFGASNIGKLLSKLNAAQREEAVNSLAYEAEYRIRDPIYGCVGLISNLQNKLKQVQLDLNNAKRELVSYIGPSTILPLPPQKANTDDNHPSASGVMLYGTNNMQQQMSMMGWLPTGATAPHGPSLTISEPRQQQPQVYEAAEQFAAAKEQQDEMFRTYYRQQQPPLQEPTRFNDSCSDAAGPGQATATAFNPATTATVAMCGSEIIKPRSFSSKSAATATAAATESQE